METPGENLDLDLEASSTGVYEIPGEPAIVINGMPDITDLDLELQDSSSSSDDEESVDVRKPNAVSGDSSTAVAIKGGVDSKRDAGFGEWLEGREVRKLFGDEFYSGKVKKYYNEAGWYRVVYEDGDSEDVEWKELEEILLPLDIAIPLKSLAMKISKKSEKPNQRKGGRGARQVELGDGISRDSKHKDDH